MNKYKWEEERRTCICFFHVSYHISYSVLQYLVKHLCRGASVWIGLLIFTCAKYSRLLVGLHQAGYLWVLRSEVSTNQNCARRTLYLLSHQPESGFDVEEQREKPELGILVGFHPAEKP